VVTGSNFMIDNWAMNSQYNSTHNLDFLLNVVEWITNTTINPIVEQQNTNPRTTKSVTSLQIFSQNNDLSITGYQQIIPNSVSSQNAQPIIETASTIENKRKRNNCF
ncbi:MAG: hypothetical protein KAS22_08910, partial [Candidatus Heimdallarchaeota archaeon]|nr:hypothetical protein [Candidatus Heimdallarchaeota archaeon]